MNQISVGELCEMADINRSTFYRHYADILFKPPSSGFLQRITDAVLQHFIDQNRLMHTASTEAVLHYQYLITGMMGIWQYWLRDDCKTPKDLFAQIILIHIGGVEQVIESRL